VSATWQWAKANPDAAARRIRELERENAKLRADINVTRKNYEVYKTDNVRLQMELDSSCNAEELRQVRAENAALRCELKRQRALWQATHALGLAERDFAIKCIETALARKEAQP
jgi:Asp-tRNA(Asn)/Glu-tRNA(Gln) amidotransferase B subunit